MEVGASIVIVVVVVAVAAFLSGYLGSGLSGSTLTIDSGGLGQSPSCSELCAEWNRLRAVACSALRGSDSAKAAVTTATAFVNSLAINAALLLAAALAAGLIPIVGPTLAASLFGLYIIAQGMVIAALGRLTAAVQLAAKAENDARTAQDAVAAARNDLVARCDNVQALNSCLSTPSPCSRVP